MVASFVLDGIKGNGGGWLWARGTRSPSMGSPLAKLGDVEYTQKFPLTGTEKSGQAPVHEIDQNTTGSIYRNQLNTSFLTVHEGDD